VLALDVGSAKIGVAISDPSRTHVFARPLLVRRSVNKDVAAILELARREAARAIVLGLPEEGTRARKLAEQVGTALAAAGAEVHYEDEGWTSAEARARIAEAGGPRDAVDAEAAVLVLEQWLRGVQR
jgi:putative Holliday junction resolvase